MSCFMTEMNSFEGRGHPVERFERRFSLENQGIYLIPLLMISAFRLAA